MGTEKKTVFLANFSMASKLSNRKVYNDVARTCPPTIVAPSCN